MQTLAAAIHNTVRAFIMRKDHIALQKKTR